MKANVKRVKITIPNVSVLKRLTTTPLFQRLTRIKLQLGDNFEDVNHFQFSEQMRMFPTGGAQIEEVK